MLFLTEGNGFWLPHDINEVIWGTIAFAIVAFVLVTKAGPAIKKGFVGRTERIQGELDNAAATKEQAEAEASEIRSKLADADAESARILAEGKELAAKVSTDIRERTTRDVAGVSTRTAAEIAAATKGLSNDVEAELRRQAVAAAEKVVAANLDPARHEELIDSLIAAVGSKN